MAEQVQICDGRLWSRIGTLLPNHCSISGQGDLELRTAAASLPKQFSYWLYLVTSLKDNPTPTRPKVSHRNILVAEDEPGVREALILLLSLDGHTVTEAADGRQALELFRHGRFDLVITDYVMPQMKGDELAAHIHLLKPSQPVIMVSAHAQSLADAGRPLVGVDAVLGK